ncbi:hypothetical protein KEJ15_08785 [Candidatus Bathyarchaeota archaeon]|nr:hypothetical protein [Candidatus Bathyarchaeota archaeon]
MDKALAHAAKLGVRFAYGEIAVQCSCSRLSDMYARQFRLYIKVAEYQFLQVLRRAVRFDKQLSCFVLNRVRYI